jgi:ribosomal protein S18 acetylase RimI-like enzyme
VTEPLEVETFDALTEGDFEVIGSLADRIWHEHYGPILAQGQIDYMIARRFAVENLRPYVGERGPWMYLARQEGEPFGYFSYAELSADRIKLEQLYVETGSRGRGIGGRMMEHVETHARKLGAAFVVLSVNKRNTASIAFYERRGYAIREAAVFDIGSGYVMDDYVMEKKLGG